MLQRRQFLKFSPSRPATLENHWLHVSRPIMACRFEVTMPSRETTGIRVANQALDYADRLEQQLTIFRDTSEVSFINRHAASKAVSVSTSLFQLLHLCQSLYRETDGAFDITSSPLSQCWGFLKRQGRIPDRDEIENAKALVGCDKLILDNPSSTVRFAKSDMQINLGSIGKGYALECLKTKIRSRIKIALLSAGSSSLLAIGSGEHGQNGWTVGIRHPRYKNKRLALLRLRDTALATSGDEEQFFEYEGKRYGHIIDPRTGMPAEKVASVTVITQSGAVADALATAFYVGGLELAEQYCSTHPDTLVILLPAQSDKPVILGNNHQCEVEMINA
jgi:thiamine biosynthesis lipoprotein